jgi:hypothetical protein
VRHTPPGTPHSGSISAGRTVVTVMVDNAIHEQPSTREPKGR